MTGPRKVRGLIGAMEAESRGEAWELEEPSDDFVPGMGLGATKAAQRWAWIGYNVEMRLALERRCLRPKGRPRKDRLASTDSWRAFRLWLIAKKLGADARRNVTTRELLALAIRVERSLDIPKSERAFPERQEGTLEQSVSRGRKILGIDDAWESEVCEEMDNI